MRPDRPKKNPDESQGSKRDSRMLLVDLKLAAANLLKAGAFSLGGDLANHGRVDRRVRRFALRFPVAFGKGGFRGIVRTLANDVVGTGPQLQMLTSEPETNRRIEREFAGWSAAVQLPEKLRTMRMAQAEDGESFAILTNNPRVDSPVKLDLRLVEAEQVTTPDILSLADNQIDGIVFDGHGNPVEYHVLRDRRTLNMLPNPNLYWRRRS